MHDDPGIASALRIVRIMPKVTTKKNGAESVTIISTRELSDDFHDEGLIFRRLSLYRAVRTSWTCCRLRLAEVGRRDDMDADSVRSPHLHEFRRRTHMEGPGIEKTDLPAVVSSDGWSVALGIYRNSPQFVPLSNFCTQGTIRSMDV